MPNRSIGWNFSAKANALTACVAATAGSLLAFQVLPISFPPAIVLLPLALAWVGDRTSGVAAAWRTGALVTWPGYALALAWVVVPVHRYGGFPLLLALPCPLLLGGAVAAFAGLFSAAIAALSSSVRRGPALPLVAAGIWASLEMARGTIGTGFPWLVASQALVPWPWLVGLAGWIGAYGLSGVVAACGTILAVWTGGRRMAAMVPILLMVLPSLAPEPIPQRVVHAALVQANIDQSEKWEPSLQETILERYLELSRQAATQKPDLIIWPETATPFYPQDPGPLTERLRQTMDSIDIPLLFGAPAYSQQESLPPSFVLHNRAYLVAQSQGLLEWYDKQHLVPFGEYVPLASWLPFLSKLVPGDYDFAPSPANAPLHLGGLRMGVLICYEAIFPEITRQHVDNGASLLINLSNDAWFGDTAAPRQHLALTALRAVESGRGIFRATNTGLTAAIAPNGRILAQAPSFTPYVLTATLPVLTRPSFYHQHYFALHAAFVALAASGLLWRRRSS
jgi:apolipoprotein N-acyltransferase